MHSDAISTCKTVDFLQAVQWLGFCCLVCFVLFSSWWATITISNLEESSQDCLLLGKRCSWVDSLQISDPLLGGAHTSAVEVPSKEEMPPFKVLLSLSCRDCIALELPELVTWPHPTKTEKRHISDVLEEWWNAGPFCELEGLDQQCPWRGAFQSFWNASRWERQGEKSWLEQEEQRQKEAGLGDEWGQGAGVAFVLIPLLGEQMGTSSNAAPTQGPGPRERCEDKHPRSKTLTSLWNGRPSVRLRVGQGACARGPDVQPCDAGSTGTSLRPPPSLATEAALWPPHTLGATSSTGFLSCQECPYLCLMSSYLYLLLLLFVVDCSCER